MMSRKKFGFIYLFIYLFISCSQNNDISEVKQVSVLRTSNVESYKWKDCNNLIVYTNNTSGFIVFDNYEILDFHNCREKKMIKYNTKDNYQINITYIPIKAFLVLTYDDCVASDYDAYQIHRKYNVPGELAINLKGYTLSKDRIKEMCLESNWELVNHGYSHSCLQTVSLQRLHKADSNRIYGWFSASFQQGVEVLLGDDIYLVKGHGSDNEGTYFECEPNLVKDYDKGTKLKLSDNQLEIELFLDVDNFTSETSIPINNFTYPYTVYDDRTIELLSTRYKSARSYNDMDNKNSADPGMNYFPFANRYKLNSASFTNYYEYDEIENVLRKAKETNALMIQYTHSWDKNFSLDKLDYLIQEANKLNITIATRQKIWEYYELFN